MENFSPLLPYCSASKSINPNFCPTPTPPLRSSVSALHTNQFLNFRSFSALPSPIPFYAEDFDYKTPNFDQNQNLEESKENEDAGKIPVKAFFLCTSVDLKSMQAENSGNVIPPTPRSSNYIALRFSDPPLQAGSVFEEKINNSFSGSVFEENAGCCRHLVVFQYGSAVPFNVKDHEAEYYLQHVRRYASGLLSDMKKDDYAIKEKPLLVDDMQGGPDHIILKNLDLDSIRIISSVLGQSIALDYFVSQVDGIVEEFTDINRGMEKSGTFTMDRKKLFQLVGKANSNLVDVILKVGLFEN